MDTGVVEDKFTGDLPAETVRQAEEPGLGERLHGSIVSAVSDSPRTRNEATTMRHVLPGASLS